VPQRSLAKAEADIIRRLLQFANREDLARDLTNAVVEPMGDGGMGSLRFRYGEDREQQLGKAIATAQALDRDGVVLSIALNVDASGRLFELDVWKVDFSATKQLPPASELTFS